MAKVADGGDNTLEDELLDEDAVLAVCFSLCLVSPYFLYSLIVSSFRMNQKREF